MTKAEAVLTVNPQKLEQAWNETLPKLLNPSDEAKVTADGKDADSLNIHIQSGGRSMYNFDFKCRYVDQREVQVELVDAERGNVSVDERTETAQGLIEDYIRHIHECAQQLKGLTQG